MVATPEGQGPYPTLLWLHGRTVCKEVDSARYLRLVRAGIAVCAIDLPGHGEREDLALHTPQAVPELLGRAFAEVDQVLAAVRALPDIDGDRLAMGGMSAGGIVTLRRLCDPHPFRCAVVEATVGDFAAAAGTARDEYLVEPMTRLDPARHLDGWRPVPLLALHSEQDQVAPVAALTSFITTLRALHPEPPPVVVTWAETGAPLEHAGFGRKAPEARRLLVGFLSEHLLG